jgi:multiple sugar transport system substrate-binding protein
MVVLGLESGSTLLRDHATRGDFSGKEFARAFAFLRRFYHHSLAPASMMEVMNVYQGFAEGYFAMYITGPWHIGEFQRRLPSELQGKWGTAPLAGLSDSIPGVSLPGGSSLVIFKSSRHKVEAWKLIEYFSRPSVQLELYRLTGTLPARREAWMDSSFAGNPLMKAFLTQLQVVRAPAKIPEWEQIAMKIQEYAEVAAQLTRSDREILQALDRDVDRILEKRRWMVENGKVKP